MRKHICSLADIGVEFAQKQFPDFEVLVATHIDTDHLHNHLVVNSVSCVNGRKLHQNAADLQQHRNANDEICIAHGLSVLEPSQKHTRKKQMRPGEYQAGLRGDSWKLDLIHTINEALEYVDDRERFMEFMENEGYQVTWTDSKQRRREAIKKLAMGQKLSLHQGVVCCVAARR